ncbi:hypothetical protein MSPP1_000358 [Malassezia sp. CBS 17886]|nr:hypothetical protein MSPP1_000358 [Malassezia sp. CBS 17886]
MPAFRPSPVALRAFQTPSRAALLQPVFQPHIGPFSPRFLIKWAPSMVCWGVAGSIIVTFAMSGVPLFRTDVLDKTPLAFYFEEWDILRWRKRQRIT